MNAGFSPGERCLIGVSGGRDSVVLLHQLRAAGFRELIVCHLDHGLRAESAEDARFVEGLAAEWGFPCVTERVDVAAWAESGGRDPIVGHPPRVPSASTGGMAAGMAPEASALQADQSEQSPTDQPQAVDTTASTGRLSGGRISLETAAREARYAFFARVAGERDCPRLFLAHHADDQVETFLFNLFRGSSASGLAGMSALTERTIDGIGLHISRPLLDVWREDIDAYLTEHRLAFREDHSNLERRFTRNRLRHEIIPALEQAFGREIRRAVWRTAEILRAEDALLDELSESENPPADLCVSELQAAPLALQRRRLHAWLRSQGVPNVGFAEVEAVRALFQGPTAKTNLPGGWHARRRAGKLFLEPGK